MKHRAAVAGLVIAAGLISVGRSWSQTPARPSDETFNRAVPVSPTAPSISEDARAPISRPPLIVPDDAFVPRPGDRLLRPTPTGEMDVDFFVDPRHGATRPAAKDFDVRAKFREAQRLADELRGAGEPGSKTDEKKKAELAKKLDAAVAAVFDSDMADREQRLSAVEQRLKNLRNLLDRRRQAKAEIVQLEVKVLTNEAAGLGFSTGSQFGLEGTGPDDSRFRRWWWGAAPAENQPQKVAPSGGGR